MRNYFRGCVRVILNSRGSETLFWSVVVFQRAISLVATSQGLDLSDGTSRDRSSIVGSVGKVMIRSCLSVRSVVWSRFSASARSTAQKMSAFSHSLS